LLDLDQAQILELFIANFRQDVLFDDCTILVRCFGSQGKAGDSPTNLEGNHQGSGSAFEIISDASSACIDLTHSNASALVSVKHEGYAYSKFPCYTINSFVTRHF
jgi:hypothetical protein